MSKKEEHTFEDSVAEIRAVQKTQEQKQNFEDDTKRLKKKIQKHLDNYLFPFGAAEIVLDDVCDIISDIDQYLDEKMTDEQRVICFAIRRLLEGIRNG